MQDERNQAAYVGERCRVSASFQTDGAPTFFRILGLLDRDLRITSAAGERRVLEINAVKLEIPEYRMAAEFLDEVFNRLGGEWIFS